MSYSTITVARRPVSIAIILAVVVAAAVSAALAASTEMFVLAVIACTVFAVLSISWIRSVSGSVLALLPAKAFVDQFWFYQAKIGPEISVNPNMVIATALPAYVVATLSPTQIFTAIRQKGNVLLLAYGVLAIPDVVFSPDPGDATTHYIRVLTGLVLLAFAGCHLHSASQVRPFFWTLLAWSLVILPGTFVAVYFGDGVSRTFSGYSVLRGPFHDKHVMAGFLVPGLAASLGFTFLQTTARGRALFLASAAALTFLIALTNSRATWIAVFVYLILWTLRARRYALFGMLILLVVALFPVIESRFMDAGVDIVGFESAHMNARTWIWASLIQRFEDASVVRKLFGLGFGASIIAARSVNLTEYYDAHNLFLMLLIENGIVGLVAFVGALLLKARVLFNSLFLTDIDPELVALREVTLGLFLYLLAAGFTGSPHKYPVFCWPAYLSLAFLIASIGPGQNETAHRSTSAIPGTLS